MTQLVNNFEGGVNGVALTGGSGGNTSSGSGDYFNAVNIGTGAIVEFTTAQVAHGSLACRLATRATASVAADMIWSSGSRGQIADDYVRFYFWTDDKTTGGIARHIFRWFGGASSLGGILMGNGRLYVADQTGAVVAGQSTTLLPLAAWCRIEAHMHPRTDGTGSLEVRLYVSPEGGVADFDLTVSGLTQAQAYTDQVTIGNSSASANWPSAGGYIYLDNIVTGASTWVGPLSTTTTTVAPTSAVSSPMMASFATELVLTPDVLAVSTASVPAATTVGQNRNPRLTGVRAAATAAGKPGGFFSTAAWKGLVVDGGSGLLPQVNWEADLGAPTNNGRSWTSIASLVRNCSFARSGRSDELQRTSPGTLTMTLDNRADAATNLGLKKAQWIRVTALWAGVTYPLWQGIIASTQRQWPSAGRDATLTVQAADTLYLLRISQMLDAVRLPRSSFPQQRADQRIQMICNSITTYVNSLVGTLDPQTDTLDAVADVSATADALSNALAVEASDNGLLIADPVGTVSYQGRQWRILNAASSVLTLGEAGGVEVSYDDSVVYDDDDSRLANFVSVTPLGASSPQSAEDAASEALYWTRHNQTVDRSLLSSDANLALSAAQYLVTRYKDPPPRIPALTLNMVTVPSAQKPTVLSLANSQRVTWKRAAAAAIQTDGFVEQIQHTLQPGSSWTTTLQLSPATLETAWVLGDATYGQLGTGTVLSY